MSNRILKKEIIDAIKKIDDERALRKISDTVKEVKKPQPNIHKLLELAGTMTEEEGDAMLKVINEEFSKIEGEW